MKRKYLKSLKYLLALALSFLGVASSSFSNDFQNVVEIKSAITEVCFTPGGNCTGVIVNEINQAKQIILVQAYSFTSAPIAKAILDAFQRGVKVQIILDKGQKTQRYSVGDFFVHAGIPTFIDAQHSIAHNKVIIIDSSSLITGSFNFTKAAQEKNAENLLVLHDSTLLSLYKKNWEFHFQHSSPFSLN